MVGLRWWVEASDRPWRARRWGTGGLGPPRDATRAFREVPAVGGSSKLLTLNISPSVPEEKYLTLEGFHKFVIDRAKQDIRSVWRAILSCGYDLHFER